LQRHHIRSPSNHNDVRAKRDQFGRGKPRTVLIFDIASFDPTQLLQRLAEHRFAGLSVRIGFSGGTGEHADAPHPLGLLRACRERPYGCRAPE
jgi:hypothetical protein